MKCILRGEQILLVLNPVVRFFFRGVASKLHFAGFVGLCSMCDHELQVRGERKTAGDDPIGRKLVLEKES